MAYFKALEGIEKPELVENSIDKDPEPDHSEENNEFADDPDENV